MDNKTKVVGVRFESKYVKILKKVSKERGEDMSDFVRRSVLTDLAKLSFLDNDTKKALGI